MSKTQLQLPQILIIVRNPPIRTGHKKYEMGLMDQNATTELAKMLKQFFSATSCGTNRVLASRVEHGIHGDMFAHVFNTRAERYWTLEPDDEELPFDHNALISKFFNTHSRPSDMAIVVIEERHARPFPKMLVRGLMGDKVNKDHAETDCLGWVLNLVTNRVCGISTIGVT